MNKLIPNDYSRCDNEACNKKLTCKRFLQLEIDFNQDKPDRVLVTTFKDFACLNYLELKPEPNA